MTARDLIYILCGYLSGSILFARIVSELLYRRDVTCDGADQNPGTSNAFKCGGFLCGVLTLLGDLGKGFLPVHLYLAGEDSDDYGLALALVIAAPVIGHILPIFFKFKGGKGIAVSFGTLLGLFPFFFLPGLMLAAAFIFFSLIVVVSPHYYRTIAAYGAASAAIVLFSGCPHAVIVGFIIGAISVTLKLLRSSEEKEALEVRLAWKH